MRKLALVAFAFIFTISSTSTLFAQSYPWRSAASGNSATVPTPTRTEPIRVASKPQSYAPAPPQMKRKPFMVSFKKQEQSPLADSQPSISDLNQYSTEIPAAPEVNGELQSVIDSNSSPEPALQVESNAATDVETNYCDRDCRKSFCNLGCERKLFGQSCSGLEVGGWFNLGYHNRNNILVNNRKAEANLHQAWLYFDKAASRNSSNWDIGYHADVLYGIDAQDLQAFGNPPTGAPSGWDNNWDNGSYGFALPTLYLQFANADWDVKVGKFFSPFGYEVIGATGNFFYSHTYTMYNLSLIHI